MSIFDFLSEAKIQDWLKRKDTQDDTPSPKVGKTTFGKPVEGYLMDEIKDFLKQAHLAKEEDKKKQLLAKATALEIQLSLSYETQGQHFLVQHAQNELQKYKNALSQS